jgi:hypothetical protein
MRPTRKRNLDNFVTVLVHHNVIGKAFKHKAFRAPSPRLAGHNGERDDLRF